MPVGPGYGTLFACLAGMASLRRALFQLWQHIERFPIPLEDALWIIEAYGDAGAARDALAQRDRRRSGSSRHIPHPR